jgi:hypothetical protein
MTTAVKEKEDYWTIELTSDCRCYDCNNCGVGYVGVDYGTKCEECAKELTPASSCISCWEDSENNFYEALEAWREKVGVTWDLVRIDGIGLGWNKDSGYAVKRFKEALKALTINGDFRITATWDGATSFTASRASHDEPTGGARFTFTLIGEED